MCYHADINITSAVHAAFHKFSVTLRLQLALKLSSAWIFHTELRLFLKRLAGPRTRIFRVRSMNLKTAGYPRFRLFTPVPLVFFLCSFDSENETSCPAGKSASRLKNQSASAASTAASTVGGFTILKSSEYILETSTISATQNSM